MLEINSVLNSVQICMSICIWNYGYLCVKVQICDDDDLAMKLKLFDVNAIDQSKIQVVVAVVINLQ